MFEPQVHFDDRILLGTPLVCIAIGYLGEIAHFQEI